LNQQNPKKKNFQSIKAINSIETNNKGEKRQMYNIAESNNKFSQPSNTNLSKSNVPNVSNVQNSSSTKTNNQTTNKNTNLNSRTETTQQGASYPNVNPSEQYQNPYMHPMYYYPPQNMNFDPNQMGQQHPMMPFYYMPPPQYTMPPIQDPNDILKGSQKIQPQKTQVNFTQETTQPTNMQYPQYPQYPPYMYYNQNPYQMNQGYGMSQGTNPQFEGQNYGAERHDPKNKTQGKDESQPSNYFGNSNFEFYKQNP